VPPRLHTPGKLGSRRGVNSLGGVTYLTDSLSGTRFLVDTGAAVSVLPYTGTRSCPATHGGPSLAGADGTSFKSWGKIYRTVSFGGRRFPDVPFVQAAVNKPILGADFFSQHKLLVDTAGSRVLDAATLLPLGEPASGKDTGLVPALSAVPPPVRSLLAEISQRRRGWIPYATLSPWSATHHRNQRQAAFCKKPAVGSGQAPHS
jgi:hypothetical protein